MLHAVKLAEGADDTLEGLGIPYGGPHNGRDVEGEFFTPATDLCQEWFAPGDRPVLYHHGLDEDAGTTVVGRVTDYKATDLGEWTKVQLDRQSKYFDAIVSLVKAGKLFFSSGAMAHLVQKKKSGEITRWPWIELSLTPTPANLLAELDFATAEKHFEAAGVKSAKLDELKGMTEGSDAAGGYVADGSDGDDDDEPVSKKAAPSDGYDPDNNDVGAHGKGDFAYVDSNGRGHLPIHDAAHVRAALSRFNQTQFESADAKAAARRKLLAAAKRFDIDVSGDDNAKMADLLALEIDADLEDSDEMPLTEKAARLSNYAALVTADTKGLHDRRIKEGRVLSTANRTCLSQTAEALEAALTALRALLDTTEPQPAKAASVDRTTARARDAEMLRLYVQSLVA